MACIRFELKGRLVNAVPFAEMERRSASAIVGEVKVEVCFDT